MSASHAPELDAIALQLVAALERYEGDVARMVDGWLDMDLYGNVSGQIEQIRAFSGALPQFGVSWVELLIAHAALVHALWRQQFREERGEPVDLTDVRERHAQCVAQLRGSCLRYLRQHPVLRA